jgi:hypothetical protein
MPRGPVPLSVPFAPLERWLVDDSAIVGVNRHTVGRWRTEGRIPIHSADRLAIHWLGLLPYSPALWGDDWFHPTTPEKAAA